MIADLLVGKIEARKMKEGHADNRQHTSLSAGIEDFCETFERTVKPVVVSIWLTADAGRSEYKPLDAILHSIVAVCLKCDVFCSYCVSFFNKFTVQSDGQKLWKEVTSWQNYG